VKLFLRSYSNAVCCETPPTLEGMYQLQALESIPILGPPAGRGRAGFPSFWLPVPHTVQSDSVLTTDQTSRLNLNEFMTDMSTNAISRLRALATLDKTLKPAGTPSFPVFRRRSHRTPLRPVCKSSLTQRPTRILMMAYKPRIQRSRRDLASYYRSM
jgi:hypothetical protein